MTLRSLLLLTVLAVVLTACLEWALSGRPTLVATALAHDGGGDGDGGGNSGPGGGDDGGRSGDSGDSDDDDDDDDDDAGATAAGERGGRDHVVRGELVLLSAPLDERQREALRRRGFRVISEDSLAAFGARVVRLAAPRGLDETDALALASSLIREAVIDFNHLYTPGGSLCDGSACWGHRPTGLISLPPGGCARSLPLAIIDTGVARGEPALAGARIVTQRFLRAGAAPAPPDHGTAVAALLVGEPAPGVPPLAPGARLLVAEVFAIENGQPHADAVSVLRAIDWAVRNGAGVIALSIEGAPNRALAFAVAAGAGAATLVAAAGNGGPNGLPAYPAAYPEVIAVSAVDARLRPYRNGTRGDYVELAAPGVDIVSAAPGGATRSWSGSSFAVPYVAAAILRALAQTGGDHQAARNLLARTAEDLGPRGRDPVYGHGLLRSTARRCY